MDSKRTVIVVPTYNENKNVEPMCEQLLALPLDADVVFMDDHSPDGTGEIIDRLSREHPRVQALHRPGKLGIGSAHRDAICWAYEHGYTRLCTMDCDFTHRPSDIPQLIEASGEADLAVGSRWLAPDSLPGWNPWRKTLTHLGHLMTQTMLGVQADATGAFRVYRLDRIPRALWDLVREDGYAFFFESMLVMHSNRLSIREVPITLPARTYGSSKMDARQIGRSIAKLGSLAMKRSLNPAQFAFLAEGPTLDPSLPSAESWDTYWDGKSASGALAYDLVATTYRKLVIEKNLVDTLRRVFPGAQKVLHAGCGSGQVDTQLRSRLDITAVDISPIALKRYLLENPGAKVFHADILHLPFPDASFDGAYNLGVVEHFRREDVVAMFRELRRVTRPGGKIVVFWPHARASSVLVLDSIHWWMKNVQGNDSRLHPPEPMLVHSRDHAAQILGEAGLALGEYHFGPRDLFVQAIVVAERPAQA